MITCGSILSGPEVSGRYPEAVGPFNDFFITDRALIWDNMVAIFQGSDAWTYLNPSKKHRDGKIGYNLIYNHYLGPSNIDHMEAGAENKLAWCTYTEEKRNWTFNKYDTLHKEKHNIFESLVEHIYTSINQRSKAMYLSKGIKKTGLYSFKTRII